MKDDRIYLHHILECLDAIQGYIAAGPNEFFKDRKTQKATLRELHELAESTQRLSQSLRDRHPEVSWRDIGGFRNVIVHDYLGLSLSRIWNIIQRDLPPLRSTVEAMLRDLGNKGQ